VESLINIKENFDWDDFVEKLDMNTLKRFFRRHSSKFQATEHGLRIPKTDFYFRRNLCPHPRGVYMISFGRIPACISLELFVVIKKVPEEAMVHYVELILSISKKIQELFYRPVRSKGTYFTSTYNSTNGHVQLEYLIKTKEDLEQTISFLIKVMDFLDSLGTKGSGTSSKRGGSQL